MLKESENEKLTLQNQINQLTKENQKQDQIV